MKIFRRSRIVSLARAASFLAVASVLAPDSFGCEMCKAAMAARDGHLLSSGLNVSILFMLAMVFSLPLGFGFVVWRSFRSEARRRARGEDVSTPGALRWTEEPRQRE